MNKSFLEYHEVDKELRSAANKTNAFLPELPSKWSYGLSERPL